MRKMGFQQSKEDSNDVAATTTTKKTTLDNASELNRIKMERWIQMHYQIKERELAMEIARNRELFYWIGGLYAATLLSCIPFYQRTKKKIALMPLLPLTFVFAYFGDLAYGSKLHRIQAEAEMIMQHEPELLQWPEGLPTVASIDEARVEVEMEKKMHPHHV